LANYLGLTAVLFLMVLFFTFMTKNFFSLATFNAIANSIPTALFLATGMTFVLIIAGIDLSVGSVSAFAGAVLGVLMVKYHAPLAIGVAGCIAAGVLCGAINGAISVVWSIPSFIVTLGMLEAARGGCYVITNSQTQYIGARIRVVAETGVGTLSVPFLFAIAVAIAAQCVLSFTSIGRHLLAIGAKEEAARLSGISIRRLKFAVFIFSSVMASCAAIVDCSRFSALAPSVGIGYELTAIAAVVIGGTSLMGGRGSVIGSVFGVLILAVLESGLAQFGAGEPTKRIVTGVVIVVAVIVDYYRSRLRGTHAAN